MQTCHTRATQIELTKEPRSQQLHCGSSYTVTTVQSVTRNVHVIAPYFICTFVNKICTFHGAYCTPLKSSCTFCWYSNCTPEKKNCTCHTTSCVVQSNNFTFRFQCCLFHSTKRELYNSEHCQ